MARKFTHPQVQALEVNQSAAVMDVTPAVLKRRVEGFAKRSGRRFQYDFGEVCHFVTRLPDPEPRAE